MKAGKYSIKELFNNRDIEQILIPEIQRDYVWGEKQINSFLNSLLEDYSDFTEAKLPFSISNTKDKVIIKNFEDFYKKQKFSSSIGFIYAYNDAEYAGKYFLIDGQQRLTTIYLLLLNLHIKLGLQEVFKTTYQSKFDYKVREATSSFFNNFIKHVIGKEGNFSVKRQFWYYSEYENDVTIQSVLKNYELFESSNIFEEIDLTNFLEYLEHYVDFYYFDTNISEQGEELYLYMNSRGETVEENENIKADLLRDVEDKVTWGMKWELWQDFFWEHRGKNKNADIGFNSFLSWIEVKELQPFIVKQFENKNKLEIIEAFFLAYKTLVDKNDAFHKSSVTGMKIPVFGSVVNAVNISNSTKLFFHPLFILLSKKQFVYYDSRVANYRYLEQDFQQYLETLIRFIRFFYNVSKREKGNNYVKLHSQVIRLAEKAFWGDFVNDVTDLIKYSDEYFENKEEKDFETEEDWEDFIAQYEGFKEVLNDETVFKLNLYNDLPKERHRYETVIWKLEDHEFLNGRIYDFLFSYGDKDYLHLNELEQYSEYFYTLFPRKDEKVNAKQIQSLLLFYGYMGQKESPHYYDNRNFGIWEKNVNSDAFTALFEDYYIYKDLDKLIFEKKKEVLLLSYDEIRKETKKTRQLFIYSIFFDYLKRKDFWEFGNYIAIEWEVPEESRFFEKEWYYTNTKGNQRGHSLLIYNNFSKYFDETFYNEVRKAFGII